MSIFFISSITAMTRCAFSVSGSLRSLGSAVGVICHDTPYLSLSQPHGPSSPPSARLSQYESTSSLGLAAHLERDSLAEGEVRATVQRDEELTVEFELDRHHGPRRRAPRSVVRDLSDLELGKMEA